MMTINSLTVLSVFHQAASNVRKPRRRALGWQLNSWVCLIITELVCFVYAVYGKNPVFTFRSLNKNVFPEMTQIYWMEVSSIFSSRSREASPDSSGGPEWQHQKTLWGDIEQHHKHFHAYQSDCSAILYSADKPKRLTRKKIAVQSISFVWRFPLSQHVFLAIDQSWYLRWAERLYQCDFATLRSQVLGAAISCDKSSHFNTATITPAPRPKGHDWSLK